MAKTAKTTKAVNKPADLHRLSQGEAAVLIGKSPVYLRDHGHKFLQARNADKTYNGQRLVRAMIELCVERAVKAAPPAENSPALERWREERARMAEIQRMRMEGVLFPIEPMRQFNNRTADLMRRTRERGSRYFDGEHRDWFEQSYDDMIDDIERLADEMFGEVNSDTEGADNVN